MTSAFIGYARLLADGGAQAEALDGLSEAVTLSTAVRDATGAAVDMRLTYMNAAAQAGQPDPAGSIGALCSRLWPQMVVNGSFDACMRVLNTGVPESGRFWWTEQETYLSGGYSYHASRLGADTLLWELRYAGADLARAEVLAAVTVALAHTSSVAEVVEALITHGLAAVGADSGGVVLPDAGGRHYVVMSSLNLEQNAVNRFSFDIDAPYPMAHTARTGEALFFRTAAERGAAFPEGERFFSARHASSAVLPLRVDDRLLGGVSFHFREPRDFDAAEQAFLSALTGQCAQALERTRLRDASARAYTQLEVLAGLSDELAAAADEHAVFEALLTAVIPRLANGGTVHLDGGTGPRLVASTYADPDRLTALRSLLDRFPPPADAPGGIGKVLRTGTPEVVTDPAAAFDRLARSNEHRAILATSPATSWLVAPMQHADDRIGALTLIRDGDEPFGERDIPFATELGRRAAAAISRVRDFTRQRQVAHLLQRELLPRALPSVPGISFGSCYRTGERDLEAGGDFYDVFPAATGRQAVMIGDICGTGAVAAARTALVRHSTRAFGQLLPGLGEVTGAVNTALRNEGGDGGFCTLAYATLDLRARPFSLHLTLAGHPQPILRRADGSVEAIGVHGTVLGVTASPRHIVTRHELHPGDTVVLYTDGAIERRNGTSFLGEAGLHRLVAEGPADTAAGLVEHLQKQIIAYGDGPLRDDLAILAIRIT